VINSGNGSLMRLSPVPAALHRDPAKAIVTASLQSRVTHSSPLCVDACILATAYMIGFYHAKGNARERKQTVLNPDFTPFADGSPIRLVTEQVRELHEKGSYKNRQKSEVMTDGFVISTLEAGLWALWRGNTFEEVFTGRLTSFRCQVLTFYRQGLMLLLPLGNDVDTVCAVYGQLGGSLYGYDEIPRRWLEKLQRQDVLNESYEGIIALGMQESH
ncbi:hypothetical protein FRC07_006842, partial [Ceratobasidium sp. 392]